VCSDMNPPSVSGYVTVLAQVFSRSVTVSISDILTLGAALLALDQYRKNRASSRSVADLKASLFKQRSSQYFDDISRKAATLSSTLLSRNWPEASRILTELGGLVSSVSGFSGALMVEDEKRDLDAATKSLRAILDGIPVNPNAPEVPDDRIKELMQHCMVVVYAVERVGGRIRYIGEVASDKEPRRLWGLGKSVAPTAPVALETKSEPPMENDNG
jgi:hypothetical protein